MIGNKLIENGYDETRINTCVADNEAHGELAWRKYFKKAYNWRI